jgi:hypothetical protein
MSEKYGEDAEERLKSAGIKKVLVFLQAMPQGDHMVIYTRTGGSLEKTMHDMFTGDNKFSGHVKEQILDMTGIDLSRAENVPDLRLMTDWKDTKEALEEKHMLKMPWCYAVPIKPGKTDEAMKFFEELNSTRLADIVRLLRDHDVVRRLVYMQRSAGGDYIIQFLLASSPLDELIMAMTSCGHEICGVLKKGAMDFSGIDFSSQKNVPNVELLFKWDDRHGFKTADQVIAYTE